MKCPYCKKESDYREWMIEEELTQIIGLAATFGGHGRLVWEYVEKFSVSPLMLKSKKALRLFQEVAKLFEQKRFTFKKRVYEISEKGIIEGLTIVNNQWFEAALGNHNYLKKVLSSLSLAEQFERRAAEDKALRKREEHACHSVADEEAEDDYLSKHDVAERARALTANIRGME
jgi:hypothetical protein